MKTKYTIQNFKVFDKKGVTVEFAPLTFLVGCNSSGKSSIVKSLTLLKTHFDNVAQESRKSFMDSFLDFNVRPNESLGKFQKVINEKIRRAKDKVITLGYTIHSYHADDDIRVSLSFAEGSLGNAKLTAVCVYDSKNNLILSTGERFIKDGNLFLLKEAFKRYVPAMTKDNIAFSKFEETGILCYFSILDELRNSNPDEARSKMLSKVTSDNKKLYALIEKICDDFADGGEIDFLSYYRKKENQLLADDRTANIFFSKHLFGDDPFISTIVRQEYLLFEQEGNELENSSISFEMVYVALANISQDHRYDVPAEDFGISHSLLQQHFKKFANSFLEEVLNTDITERLSYVSSSRVQVRRMYTLEDKNEFSEMIKSYYEAETEFKKLNPPVELLIDRGTGNYNDRDCYIPYNFMPGNFISKWLRIFGIGERYSIDLDENGIGFLLKVYKPEKDTKGVLLADMGYGITQLFSILLQIETSILRGLTRKFKNYESGAIIYGDFDKSLSPTTIAIEEPEIHLHPKYQSLLAEMFFEAYKEYNIQFIIETHSEYLLRKIQTIIGNKNLGVDDVSMIYVEDPEAGDKGLEKIRRIPIKEDGRLSEPFGPGFYDEADNLSLELFTNMSR